MEGDTSMLRIKTIEEFIRISKCLVNQNIMILTLSSVLSVEKMVTVPIITSGQLDLR
jgi:hypothetical protein